MQLLTSPLGAFEARLSRGVHYATAGATSSGGDYENVRFETHDFENAPGVVLDDYDFSIDPGTYIIEASCTVNNGVGIAYLCLNNDRIDRDIRSYSPPVTCPAGSQMQVRLFQKVVLTQAYDKMNILLRVQNTVANGRGAAADGVSFPYDQLNIWRLY